MWLLVNLGMYVIRNVAYNFCQSRAGLCLLWRHPRGSQANWCELMAIQTPTVNREFALAPAKLAGAQPLSHHSSWPSIHNFWRVGTAIHNLNGCDSQLGTLDSQLDSQLLAGKMARMAISEQRSPFPRCVFTLTRAFT